MTAPRQITTSGRAMVEYGSMSPFSQDNQYFVVVAPGGFQLFRLDGTFVMDLPIAPYQEPRWSKTHPQILYYVVQNALMGLDVDRKIGFLEHAFSEYTEEFIPGKVNFISGRGESDISEDGDHFVFSTKHEVFVYQISTQKKVATLKVEADLYDSLYITPDNNVIIGFNAIGMERFHGIEFYDSELRFVRQLASRVAHMDVGRDQDQSEVLIWPNAAISPNSPDFMPDCVNGIVMTRLSDGRRTCLHSLIGEDPGWSQASDYSCPDVGAFCLISFYGPENEGKYSNRIIKLYFDGTIEVIGDHMSRPLDPSDTYTWQPRGSISRDGRYVLFNSNAGQLPFSGYSNVYLVDLAPVAKPIEPPMEQPPIIVLTEDVGLLKSQLTEKDRQIAELRAKLQEETRQNRIVVEYWNEAALAVERLESQLANPEPDPALWSEIDFLNPSQVGRRWGYTVLPSGHLSLSDIQGDIWTPIDYKPLEGNRWEFLAKDGELRMFEKRTNKKP